MRAPNSVGKILLCERGCAAKRMEAIMLIDRTDEEKANVFIFLSIISFNNGIRPIANTNSAGVKNYLIMMGSYLIAKC